MENQQNFQATQSVETGIEQINVQQNAAKEQPTAVDIQAWLVSYLAKELELDPNQIDITIPFDRYGLESSAAVTLTGDLETWLGQEIEPTLLYDYPTIEAVGQYLAVED